MTGLDHTPERVGGRHTNGHNRFPADGLADLVKRERDDAERDACDERAADQYRVRDLASAPDHSADALADLGRVMVHNADVFTSSKVLAHIERFADARHAERYAVAFGVLLRAVLAVPPHVVLPPTIGGAVSLNMLLAVVGASGGGKGTADKVAADAVRLSVGGRGTVPSLPMLPVGTGEGINRTYAESVRDRRTGVTSLRWHTRAALFGCRDIATLDALTARRGTTLLPELLKAYMGEELGFANADKDRRVILPMHSYRLCLSAGVQPENGAVLLNDQAQRDGVPQRFVWAPVRPGVARSSTEIVEPLTVPVPDFGGTDPMADAQPLSPLAVASDIRQQILDADAAKDLDPFGRCVDPLAGHRLLAQLKLAAALAVLHDRTEVGTEDWQRAERLMAVSTAVARAVAAASADAERKDAARQGERFAVTDEARDTAALHSLMDRVTRYLVKQPDWVAHGAVTRSVTGKLRRNLPDALVTLLDSGAIERREVTRAGQKVYQYRFGGV